MGSLQRSVSSQSKITKNAMVKGESVEIQTKSRIGSFFNPVHFHLLTIVLKLCDYLRQTHQKTSKLRCFKYSRRVGANDEFFLSLFYDRTFFASNISRNDSLRYELKINKLHWNSIID